MPIRPAASRKPCLFSIATCATVLCALTPAQAQVSFNGIQSTIISGITNGGQVPNGTAIDKAGNVWVSGISPTGGTSYILKYPKSNGYVYTGTFFDSSFTYNGQGTPESSAYSIAFDSQGILYVPAAAANSLYAWNVGSPGIGTAINGGVFPNGVSYGLDGNIYMADAVNADTWLVPTPFNPSNPAHEIFSTPCYENSLAADVSGNVYVICGSQVLKYTNNGGGNYSSSVVTGSLNNQGYLALGIVVDRSGVVYVNDSHNSRILREVPKPGGGYGESVFQSGYNNPEGLSMDSQGNLYVSDSYNGNIDLISFSPRFGSQAVGTSSGAQTFSFTVVSGTTVGSIAAVTTGQTGQDFTSTTTCPLQAFAGTTRCNVTVTFTPQAAGLREGAIVFYDGNGNQLASVPITGTGTAPQIAFNNNQSITNVGLPFGTTTGALAVDAAGNLFAATHSTDQSHYPVVAGNIVEYPIQGSTYGAAVTVATLNDPLDVAIAPNGDLIVIGITASTGTAVYSIPRTSTGYGAPAVIATNAQKPTQSVAVDSAGDIFYVVYNTSSGISTVFEIPKVGPSAGTPVQISTGLALLGGIALDASANLYVSNLPGGNPYQGQIVEFTASSGYANSITVVSNILLPSYIAVEPNGSLLYQNNDIYELPLNGSTFGAPVSLTPNLTFTNGFAIDRAGNLFSNSLTNNAVQIFHRDGAAHAFATTPQGSTSADSPQIFRIENFGNQPLDFSEASFPAAFPESSSESTDCSASTVLASASFCTLTTGFSPDTAIPAGQSSLQLTGDVTIATNSLNALNAVSSVTLSGLETMPAARLTLTSSSYSTIFGTPVTLTATATGGVGLATAAPSGTVQFFDGATSIGSGTLTVSSGAVSTASLALGPTALAAGAHTLTFTYSGDSNYAAGTRSAAVTVSVSPVGAATQLVFGNPPPAIGWVGSNAGIGITVIEETAGGLQNYTATGAITLKVTGPSSYSLTYTATAAAGMATFNLSSGALTSAGTYTYTATLTGLSPATATESVTAQNAGTASAPASVMISIAAGGTLNAIQALTGGALNADFSVASGGTCAVGAIYSAGQSCTLNVVFTPRYAGLRNGAVLLEDAGGNALGTAYVSGIGQGPQIAFGPGQQTLLGSGLNGPNGSAVDGNGNVYIADQQNGRIVEVPWTGSGYGSQVTVVGYHFPRGVAVDGAGNLYVTDLGDMAVVKFPWNGNSFGTPFTIGSGFGFTWALAVDAAGNVYVVDGGDFSTPFVWKIPWTGSGYGPQVKLGSGWQTPSGVAVDVAGNVYVADQANSFVSELPWTGSGYGAAVQVGSGLNTPSWVAVDAIGSLFIADTGNGRVVKEPWTSGGFGLQTTVLGGLNKPEGISVDGAGNLYIVNSNSNSVIKLDLADAPAINFSTPTLPGSIDTADGPQKVSIVNSGNQGLIFSAPQSGSNPSYPANFPENTGDSPLCTTGTILFPGVDCDVSMNFKPTAAGANSGGVVLTTNSLNKSNAMQTIGLTGTTPATPTITWATPTAIPYGTALSATQLDATASVPGTFVYTPAAGVVPSAGTIGLSVVFTPTDTVDYTTATEAIQLVVNPVAFTVTPIGQTAPAITISFALASAVTLGPIQVLTAGVTGLDFANAGTGTCVAGTSYAAGAFCTVAVSFTPRYAGSRLGAVVLTDNAGNVLATNYFSGVGSGPQAAFTGGAITTFGTYLQHPAQVAVDGAGNMYVADSTYGAFKITPAGVQAPIGSGWWSPQGIAVDAAGNVFVADFELKEVVRITPGGVSSKVSVNLVGPGSLAADSAGNIYVADFTANVVYMVTPWGTQTPIGSGFSGPESIAVDGAGNVYEADSGSSIINKIAPGGTQTQITTTVLNIIGLAADGVGNLYASSLVGGSQPVYEIAANGTQTLLLTSNGDYPFGLAIDGAGNLYAAYNNGSGDYPFGSVARLDRADPPAINFATPSNVGSTDTADGAQTVTVQNIGNIPLSFAVPNSGSNPAIAGNFSLNTGASACPLIQAGGSAASLLPGANCSLSVSFTPLNAGRLTGMLSLTNNTLQGNPSSSVTQSLALSGVGLTIDWPAPAPIVQSTALSATQLNATSPVAGTFTYSPAAGTVLPAGVQTLTATFTPANMALYQTLKVSVPITVLAPFTAGGSVGTASSAVSYGFTFPLAATLGSIAVLTQGSAGMDFANAGTGTCAAGTGYAAGASCTVNVTFTPKYAGLRIGAVELLDGAGNILASDAISGIGNAPQITFSPGAVSVPISASSAAPNFFSNDAIADAAGNLYVAYSALGDPPVSAVVKLPWTGSGYGSPATLISAATVNNFFNPVALAIDGAGSLFIVDGGNYDILKLPWNGSSYGAAVTVVGSTIQGQPVAPFSIAVDAAENLYVVDDGTFSVLKLPWNGSSYGAPITVANAAIYGGSFLPMAVAVDSRSNVFICLEENVVIEMPWNGTIWGAAISLATTSTNGPNFSPEWIAVDGAGSVYIADYGNGIASKIPWSGSAFGAPVTVAGSAVLGAGFAPNSIAVDQRGNLLLSGYPNSGGDEVLQVDLADTPSMSFATATPVGSIDTTDGPQTVSVSNIGTQPLVLTSSVPGGNPSYPASFPANAADANLCAAGTPLAAGASCDVSVKYEPTTAGANTGSVVLTDNALNQANATQSIALSGANSQAALTAPAPGSVLTGPAVTFTWSAGAGAAAYQLWIGKSGVNTNDVYSSGIVTSTSVTPLNLPLNGATLYARLYTEIGGSWYHADYTYTAPAPAILTAPGTSGTLPGPLTVFTWTAPAGAGAYQLWLGSTGVNSNNLFSSGLTHSNTTTRTNIPTNGETIYARLFTDFNGTWVSNYYVFTAPLQSVPVSPAIGSTLAGPAQTFTWTAGTGSSIGAYQFWLGSTGVGSNDVYSSGILHTTSVTRTNMPTNGEMLYARLYTDYNGTWVHQDYTLTAAAQSVLISPAPGSTLSGANVTFNWSAATGSATQYQLWIGTTGVGSNNFYSSGAITATSVTRTNMPINGATLYVRLYTNFNGTWTHIDYTLKAAP